MLKMNIRPLGMLMLLYAAALVCAGAAAAQEHRAQPRVDSVRTRTPLVDPRFFFSQAQAPLPLSTELAFTPDYYTSILFEPSAPSPFFFSRREAEKADLTAPLKLQLARQERYSTMQSILGAVQAGGTVYLAYRYLKKHGFK